MHEWHDTYVDLRIPPELRQASHRMGAARIALVSWNGKQRTAFVTHRCGLVQRWTISNDEGGIRWERQIAATDCNRCRGLPATQD